MRKSRLLFLTVFFSAASLVASLPAVALAQAGPLIKGSTPAVYYVDEGKRYVFPNEKVYFSWYADFSSVRTVSDEELASYLIGGNVTYKPGARLVKLQSDPRVFAVGAGGRLRWLTSEDAARVLYGDDWNRKVDDLPDAFFFTYKDGEPVASIGDFDRDKEMSVGEIADDLAARNGAVVSSDFTAVKIGAWSDPSVWGGRVPASGARVSIPADMKVFYDLSDAPSLKSLEVLGTLEFSATRSTRLAARQITVRGVMTAGSAQAPISADKTIEIALTGAASTPVADDGLTIDGGTLALYGADVGASWTRLAAAAETGATQITLETPVIWPLGAEIAILGATSAEQETRHIKAIAGTTVTLDVPLSKAHRFESGLKSEVALLDRNISIKGVGGGMGSYVRGINRAKIAVQDVLLSSLGRKGAAGQFPLLLDGVTDAIVAGDVIRDSGNRCISLRQVKESDIRDNVAFNVYGHCIATEDGAETGNAITGNLVASVHGGALTGDALPAAFLLKNPDNHVEDNVAVGTDGFGYWYLLADDATTNAGAKLRPRETALGSFSNDIARANAKVGLYIDDGKGKGDYIPSAKATFTGLTSVLNGERGFWMRGVNLEVSGATLAENPIGGTFAAFGATLKDSTIMGRLEHSGGLSPARYGFTFDDGPISLQDVTFMRFSGGAAALGFEEKNAELPDPRSGFRHLTFVESNVWHATDPTTSSDQMSVVHDFDNGDMVGTDSAFLGKDCAAADGNVRRCPGAYAQLEVALRDGSGDKEVVFTELGSGASVTLSPGSAFDGRYAYANVAEGGSYHVSVPNLATVELSYDGLTAPLQVRIPAGLGASVRSDGAALPKKELSALTPGAWAYDSSTAEAVLWLNPGDDFTLDR